MKEEKKVIVKGASEHEVVAAFDALELLIEHANVGWVKKFLADHDIDVV